MCRHRCSSSGSAAKPATRPGFSRPRGPWTAVATRTRPRPREASNVARAGVAAAPRPRRGSSAAETGPAPRRRPGRDEDGPSPRRARGRGGAAAATRIRSARGGDAARLRGGAAATRLRRRRWRLSSKYQRNCSYVAEDPETRCALKDAADRCVATCTPCDANEVVVTTYEAFREDTMKESKRFLEALGLDTTTASLVRDGARTKAYVAFKITFLCAAWAGNTWLECWRNWVRTPNRVGFQNTWLDGVRTTWLGSGRRPSWVPNRSRSRRPRTPRRRPSARGRPAGGPCGR